MDEFEHYTAMPYEIVGIEPAGLATVSVEALNISTGMKKTFKTPLKKFQWGVGEYITFSEQGVNHV